MNKVLFWIGAMSAFVMLALTLPLPIIAVCSGDVAANWFAFKVTVPVASLASLCLVGALCVFVAKAVHSDLYKRE